MTLDSENPMASSSPMRRLMGQMLSYVAIGGAAALAYVVLVTLVTGLETGIADWLLGAGLYLLFIGPVYLLQRRLAFRSGREHRAAFPRYAATQGVSLLLVTGLGYLFYTIFGLTPPLGTVLVIGIATAASFVLLRFWAFPDESGSDGKVLLNSVHDAAVFQRRVAVLSRHLADAVPSGGSVLDLGSGDGSIASMLMGRRADLDIRGVDVMLRPTSHIPVELYDGDTLPFPDDSFDHVTIVDVLHHTDDPAAVLAEAARVARVSVVIKDHLASGPISRVVLRFMDWVGNRGHDVVLPYNYLSRQQWLAAFESAGLSEQSRLDQLGIYPAPFSWLFDARLHFVATLSPKAR